MFMTEYSLIENELIKVMHCDKSQLAEYESYINNAAAVVKALLKNAEDENDVRIVNLCAMRAYYQIVLTDHSDDGITSFKAGDVSYSMDTSSVSRAKELLDLAEKSCRNLIKIDSFAFQGV